MGLQTGGLSQRQELSTQLQGSAQQMSYAGEITSWKELYCVEGKQI